MILNLLFLTISFEKREQSLEEALHNQSVQNQYEETRNRLATYLNHNHY